MLTLGLPLSQHLLRSTGTVWRGRGRGVLHYLTVSSRRRDSQRPAPGGVSGHREAGGELRYRAVPQAAPAPGEGGVPEARLSPVSPTEASTGLGI